MSEHRYGVHDCPNGYHYLRDVTDHSVYIHRNYGKLFSEYKEDIELVSSLLNDLADKVDEQQSIIQSLKEANKKCANNWKQEIVKRGKLEEEIELLKQKLENLDLNENSKKWE